MYYRKALCAQQENVDQGTLQITVHSKTDNRPVENALVRISYTGCLLYTSPSPRDAHESRMPSSA